MEQELCKIVRSHCRHLCTLYRKRRYDELSITKFYPKYHKLCTLCNCTYSGWLIDENKCILVIVHLLRKSKAITGHEVIAILFHYNFIYIRIKIMLISGFIILKCNAYCNEWFQYIAVCNSKTCSSFFDYTIEQGAIQNH